MFSLIQATFTISGSKGFTASIKVVILLLLHNRSTTLGYCYKEKAPYCACADTLASFPYTSPPLSGNDQNQNIGNKETIGLDNRVIFTPECVEPIVGLEPVQPQPWLPSPPAGLSQPLG